MLPQKVTPTLKSPDEGVRIEVGKIDDKKINEIIPVKYHDVFDSILPGGHRWHNNIDDCLSVCPYYIKCRGNGPSKTLCTENWRKTSATRNTWMVLKHIFDNFDFYNQDDLNKKEIEEFVNEITDILDFPFDESLSPTEIIAFVKIRLRHAEFKAKLFLLWGGCSIDNIAVSNRYLIASHILPWSKSDDTEKLSEYNGFLLPSNYDYLFDRYLISFDNNGQIIIHNDEVIKTMNVLYTTLGIDRNAKLKLVHDENIYFLNKHREIFDKIGDKLSNQCVLMEEKR